MRDCVPRYQGYFCVIDIDGINEMILSEAYSSWYSIHSRSTKIYRDLRKVYWWNDMRKDIAKFVAECPSCQQLKVEYQILGGVMQDIENPPWKWEDMNMDFIIT